MVLSISLAKSLIIVLYSLKDHAWKIADFGLTVPGSSSVVQTTQYSRGTAGYRAPELITESTSRYTNKVDIFAIGCILFELVFRAKAFRDDFAVQQYALSRGGQLSIPATSDVCPDERRRQFIAHYIHQMIQIDPSKRLRASDLCIVFEIGSDEPFYSTTFGCTTRYLISPNLRV
jgi:serine/threonine protein kinase